jgi:chloramphenicol 3-O phosphotransferase
MLENLVKSFHDVIISHLELGVNEIVDHVLQEPVWQSDLDAKLARYKTLAVGLFCSIQELEMRELKRGDRAVGLARFQYERVHKNRKYDLELFTDKRSVHDCSGDVVKLIELL